MGENSTTNNLNVITEELRDLNLNIIDNKKCKLNRLPQHSVNDEDSLVVFSETNNNNLSLIESDISICLAGNIKTIMMSTIVVQSSIGSEIVNIDTPIFHRKSLFAPIQEIGLVRDIFGCVDEPLYAIELHKGISGNSLKIDSPVYYVCDDQRTKFISVECDDEGRYTVNQS